MNAALSISFVLIEKDRVYSMYSTYINTRGKYFDYCKQIGFADFCHYRKRASKERRRIMHISMSKIDYCNWIVQTRCIFAHVIPRKKGKKTVDIESIY
jgi:hypothetical protein